MTALRRNPFWQVAQEELPKLGYHNFYAEPKRKGDYKIIIRGVTPAGALTEQEYPMPSVCRSLESIPNFKSALRNFVKQELPNRQCFSEADHRTRKPGMFIAKIDHDKPKKKLQPPKPMLTAVGELKSVLVENVIAPPSIPDSAVDAPKKPTEPVSDDKVLAVFLVATSDLSTLIDVSKGTAQFRGSKPAPLRLVQTPKMVK